MLRHPLPRLALLPLLTLVAPVAGCDSQNICEQAVTKINACRQRAAAADGGASDGGASDGDAGPLQLLKFAGDCNNAVLLGAGEAVAFQSWSERYVPCELDPATCLCPGLPWYDGYDPPDSVSSATPR